MPTPQEIRIVSTKYIHRKRRLTHRVQCKLQANLKTDTHKQTQTHTQACSAPSRQPDQATYFGLIICLYLSAIVPNVNAH